jgi:hypothetical protein
MHFEQRKATNYRRKPGNGKFHGFCSSPIIVYWRDSLRQNE